MSVGHMVLYRFLFASLGMLPVVLTAGRRLGPRWTGRETTTLLIAATLGIPLQFLLQFEGLARTTVSHASLMVGTMPVLLALGANIFAGERLDLIGWLALVGSTVGAALISRRGEASHDETPAILRDRHERDPIAVGRDRRPALGDAPIR